MDFDTCSGRSGGAGGEALDAQAGLWRACNPEVILGLDGAGEQRPASNLDFVSSSRPLPSSAVGASAVEIIRRENFHAVGLDSSEIFRDSGYYHLAALALRVLQSERLDPAISALASHHNRFYRQLAIQPPR